MSSAISLSPVAVWLIELYQRFLSPIKGFRCAHRARKHGRTSSCSQFAKRAFARLGVFAGFTLLQRRFDKCAASAQVLEYEPKGSKKEDDAAKPTSSWDCGDPSAACDLGAEAVGSCAGGGCDVVPDLPCDCSF